MKLICSIKNNQMLAIVGLFLEVALGIGGTIIFEVWRDNGAIVHVRRGMVVLIFYVFVWWRISQIYK